ncbi:MAG: class I SAM-dependent DNA methyltransferase [Betaproteobacteria bacterium]|nr:class I SAM-dependent DNA methyltransferase [Betaproteobacteria bacterium]
MTPEQFITRWQNVGGSERANYQLFIADLCALLELPKPDPAQDDTRDNAYVFERRVIFKHGDGGSSNGFIDCYRRGSAIIEAKKIKLGAQTKGFDDAMLRARSQAENYARALPAEEGRPPFLITIDVGHRIELFAEFTRSGATYTPFPDPRSHRIGLEDLRDEKIRARLKAIWLDPLSLDPSRASAKATREIASKLAGIAKTLESAGHDAERVAGFLTRCLFSMFAEDVGLLPKASFSELLESLQGTPGQFVPLVGALWKEMDEGGFSVVLRQILPRFNGKLFKTPDVLPLDRDQIGLLREAARADWTLVEPAIFGTLLERALDPAERHSLGAHYTPRPYVERLVLPTVIEPLRQRWANVQAAALLLANESKSTAALAEIDAFHHQLCQIRVLDPACGSANFLYVTLEHMKRLEGEILDFAQTIGQSVGGGQQRLEAEGLTVDPHQFLGLELNPRAAAIAELVLWIGYLQWHFRTRSAGLPPSPILRDFKNIECRDAVLDHDGSEIVCDEHGVPLSRWDGKTLKTHAITGEQVPDDNARQPVLRYKNPRRATWPAADYIVGNPPFIGNKRMRDALGDGYVEALRSSWSEVPESADYVMFWWQHAAALVNAQKVQRFGFITTNSLTQTFNRRVVQGALDQGISLVFAVPDHPWVDNADGAAVRIAMTVGAGGKNVDGILSWVETETDTGGEGLEVKLSTRVGVLHADLAMGANVAAARTLRSNENLALRGITLVGGGFLVTPEQGQMLDNGALLRTYRNGKDLTDKPRPIKVIDTFGMREGELRNSYPSSWQWLHDRVKPERDQNARASYRDNWWIFAEPRSEWRSASLGLVRYLVTPMTAKHRIFTFESAETLPDQGLVPIATDDAFFLGILSSAPHVVWSLASGGTLEDRPRYNQSRCFETFPFPTATPEQQARIRDLAEQLDAHRKRQQAQHATLTLTGMYNVLAKIRSGEPLTAKDKTIHEQGLVSVLQTLHDELDAAVLEAYGWADLSTVIPAHLKGASCGAPAEIQAASDSTPGAALPSVAGAGVTMSLSEEILTRLVALNSERAREEANGQIRWLRPAYQNPQAQLPATTETTAGATVDAKNEPKTRSTAAVESASATSAAAQKTAWPATLPEQMALLARLLAESALTESQLASRITGKGAWKKRLPDLLQTLVALGRARQDGEIWMAV